MDHNTTEKEKLPGDDQEVVEFIRQFEHAIKIGRDSGFISWLTRTAELCAGAKIKPQAYMTAVFVATTTTLAEDYACAGPNEEQKERLDNLFSMFRAYLDTVEAKMHKRQKEGKLVRTPRVPKKKSSILHLN